MPTSNYSIANGFANETYRSFFLTGKAGSGKTTFLQKLRNNTTKRMAVVAPTGVAAINAGGVTIHSFFQLPFTPFVPTPEGRNNLIKKIKIQQWKRKVIQELELLVIDEISMVRADLLDEIDTVLRHIRFRHHEPFGGVQVILIGDLYQLAPVAIPEEWNVLANYYSTPYFFSSRIIQEHPLIYVEFDKIFRQSDPTFVQLLNDVRDDKLTDNDFQLLQHRYNPTFDISKHPEYILLTTHNAKADKVNSQEMDRLTTPTFTFDAEISGEFPEKSYPNAERLTLREGAKVMFIANDPSLERQYFNGKIGTISSISQDEIHVKCDDNENIKVSPEVWTNIRYNVNPLTKMIEEEVLGQFKQYPLRLAWAITIHKSQGLTFDNVAIDVVNAFTSGQVYVALSRCRTLKGIVLMTNINRYSLSLDHNVVAFSSQKTGQEMLNQILKQDMERFQQDTLCSIFQFASCLGQVQQVQMVIGAEKTLFNNSAHQLLEEIRGKVENLNVIGIKFQHQLRALFQANNQEKLAERIAAASEYFTSTIDEITKLIHDADITTSDFELANDYNFGIQSIYDDLVRKRFVIKNIKEDFSTKHCVDLRNRKIEIKLKINSFKYSPKGHSISKASAKKEKKAPKESTYSITERMFKDGKDIATIAAERGMVRSTICNHIARLVSQGEISVYEFVTNEQMEVLRNCQKVGIGTKEIYEKLKGTLDYDQIRIIMAGIEYEKSNN